MTSFIVALAISIIPFDCGFAGSDKKIIMLFLSKKSTKILFINSESLSILKAKILTFYIFFKILVKLLYLFYSSMLLNNNILN
jgi:hypothetical protein